MLTPLRAAHPVEASSLNEKGQDTDPNAALVC